VQRSPSGGRGPDAAGWPEPQPVRIGDVMLSVRMRAGLGPTVVFESGLGLPAALWRSVWEELPADVALLCYDRAGLGGSEARFPPRSAADQAQQLWALLMTAPVHPPYLLVAHSAGAFIARLLAAEHAAEMAGLILVEPSQEDGPQSHPASDVAVGIALRAMSLLPVAGLGRRLERASAAMDARAHPRAVRRLRLVADVFDATHLRGIIGENAAHPTSVAQVRAARAAEPGADLPLTVITARSAADRRIRSRSWEERRRRDAALAARSSAGRHLIAEKCGHLVPIDAPEVIADAVRQALSEVRDRD
jgi:pimeloyl-ACP methyl ester carboxylesterase